MKACTVVEKYYIQSITDQQTQNIFDIFKMNIPTYFAPHELNDFKAYLKTNAATYFVVFSENQIAGGCGFLIDTNNGVGSITWIFFDPKFKGKGLGKAAVQFCLEYFKAQKGIKKACVSTSQHAYLFFEKFGFSTVKTEPNFWAEGLDLYEMERAI